MNHQEDYESGEDCDVQYYEDYENVDVHKLMLKDKPRMNFYHGILSDPTVVKDKIVVDVGSGSGILACWAALHGAAHVFSIENSSTALWQKSVFEENGVASKVTIINDSVENICARGCAWFADNYKFIAPLGGISLIVSEWMGFYLLHEGMLFSVLRARDFFRELNATLTSHPPRIEMVPSKASIVIAPMHMAAFKEAYLQEHWGSFHGVRLSTVGQVDFAKYDESAFFIEVLPEAAVLGTGTTFCEFDLATMCAESAHLVRHEINMDLSSSAAFQYLTRTAPGVAVDGFTIWFDVHFRNYRLSTSPFEEATHWKQFTMLLPADIREQEMVYVTKEEPSLNAVFTLRRPDAENERTYKMDLEL
ncbi:arginine N-methyltransferase, type I [Strigomonas culicis]|uniref:Arginine N-methyltransferase, type I n=1 Tax=Strigomonas culicis TaxID=28005 RepID=S9US27_9TRYP|nr:arginine N-methyltransferase, type I [Strigomonas culicis]|eukprot:EPY31584.1 arginine N-methyltransferase, type I [Strigomonas culicis]